MQAALWNPIRTPNDLATWSKANAVDHQDLNQAIARKSSIVAGIELANGGDGYTSAPTVTIAPPDLAGGSPATAVAIYQLSGNEYQVTFQVTDPGLGYSYPPAVTLSGGGGYGMTAIALVNYSLPQLPPLDPIPVNDMDRWALTHWLVHQEMLNAVGRQNTNLTSMDLNDPAAMQEFLWTHILDHQAVAQEVSGYLPNG